MKSSFFDLQLARAKEVLCVREDQEVAAALGLSKAAFSARKTRGSFPEKELRALAQQRPELGLDVEYVLKGGQPNEWKQRQREGAAAWMRQERVRLGHTPQEMAQEMGVSAQEYQQVEDGLRPPSADFNDALHRVEGIDRVFLRSGMAKGHPPYHLRGREAQLLDLYRCDGAFRQVVDAAMALTKRTPQAPPTGQGTAGITQTQRGSGIQIGQAGGHVQIGTSAPRTRQRN